MKFTFAWAKIAAQNVTLKVATATLAIVSIVQLVVIVQLALREAIVIERSCFSRSLDRSASKNTTEEIKAFLQEALPARFDTAAIAKEEILSLEEREVRQKEQTNLKQRQMIQKIIVEGIEVSDKEIIVQADRLISIGKVRTVLPLSLKVILQTTRRSEANPYGLVIVETNIVEESKEQK